MEEKRPLKVCSTCGFWSIQHQGYCHKFELGAGKFWFCQNWTQEQTGIKPLSEAGGGGK